MVKKLSSSKLSLLVSLLLAMLLVQCGCGAAKLTNKERLDPQKKQKEQLDLQKNQKEQVDPQKKQKETIPPPALTPITDKMIARAKAGRRDIAAQWDFLAKKLEALKDKNGVDINEQNGVDSGHSALHYAVLLEAPDIVQVLLDRGGNPNTETKDEKVLHRDKFTPLHLAAELENDIMVKSLLDKGAEVNKKNGFGKTALDTVIFKTPSPLGVIRLLVGKLSKDELNAQYNYGNTLLYGALEDFKKEVAKILLARTDIDVNIPGKNNYTPLHLAVERGYADIVKILLDKHARLDMMNDSGNTPLRLAEGKLYKNQEIIDLLKARASKK
jgi:ankyrin repeat protein